MWVRSFLAAAVLGISGPASAQQTAPSSTPAQTNAGSMGRVSSPLSANPVRSPTTGGTPASSAGAAFSTSPPATSPPATPPAAAPATTAPPAVAAPAQQPAWVSPDASPRRSTTRVTSGNGSLPNESGQLYREYDISPYTSRITTTKHPEEAILDWILRETGYEAWHGEPLAILSAAPRTLRVYHTPQMQSVVAGIVDRFNSSEAGTQAFSIRVITLDSPDWRVRVQRLLNPVPVQTQGTQAWVLEKEAAAMLLAELRRRSDYREHSSPQLLVANGQPTTVSAVRGRNYVRDVKLRAEAWPGFEPETAIIDEGFSLEFTPLLTLDGKTIEAAIRCDIDQVERFVPVTLSVPTAIAPRQSTRIEVPQTSHFRFHERFRWPLERVLVIGMGMVPSPVPRDARSLVPGLPLPFSSGPPRADLLLFVESRGKASDQGPIANRGALPGSDYYRGR